MDPRRILTLTVSLFLIALTPMMTSAQMPPLETGVSQQLARWRAAHYSDVRYKLNLTLEKMSPVLKGTMEIRVDVSPGTQASPPATPQSGVVPPIILDWRKLAGHEKDSTISNVSINGQTAALSEPRENHPIAEAATPLLRKEGSFSYAESNEHLIFRDGVVVGENVIKLDFTSPILTSGSAITRYIDKEDGSEYIYSLFVPSDASTAFPVFDQPDLKARFTVDVKVDKGWKVVSNSILTRFAKYECIAGQFCADGYGFEETKPISTYVFAFAAGPWERVAEPPASAGGESAKSSRAKASPPANAGGSAFSAVYVRKSQAAKFQPHAAEVFKLTREGVKYLEEYFDYKFPFPKYDIVLIPEFPFGGMEHAGATFLRESSVIFPSEPTANDYISRANVIFHEAAHQWFGDTVTMRWFDDLWLKEGFAEFMAYKTLERVMPQYNAWKAFYERNKPAAYFTDSTRGTTPIYQEIANLSAAKSAYGNIVYRKAPSFLRQAEFYLGPDKFQTAVRAFLKKHEYANATWQDLVSEFEAASGQNLSNWASTWVGKRGMPVFRMKVESRSELLDMRNRTPSETHFIFSQSDILKSDNQWIEKLQLLYVYEDDKRRTEEVIFNKGDRELEEYWGTDLRGFASKQTVKNLRPPKFIFPNYQDYGYGIFLLDEKSRDYVLKNIQNEKDAFLRSMMWGALWDSVREAELDPRQYVELAIKTLPVEKDETITASVLGRVSTAMTYYIQAEPPVLAGGGNWSNVQARTNSAAVPPANAGGSALISRLEAMLIDRMRTAPTLGQRLTYYRAFLSIVSTENGRSVLRELLRGQAEPLPSASGKTSTGGQPKVSPPANAGGSALPLKTKDRFDIITRLAILGDPDAPKLLADLEKAEKSDDAKRYAYAAHAAFATKENRAKFWNDFINNKDISESWIEAAMGPFNSPRHSDLSLPNLERALKELPTLKRSRKIFFVNGWLGAFIGGQKSQEALDIVNKFLADNPNLDRDLRLKVLENVDVIERAVKIRNKYS
jgi:aminopeptidase N